MFECDKQFIQCYALAMAFYLDHFDEAECEVKDVNGKKVHLPKLNVSHVLAYAQQTYQFANLLHDKMPAKDKIRFKNVLENCSREIWEVVYWLNRAIKCCKPFRGNCIRRVRMPDEHIPYFQPGKIFRFQNVISALDECKADDSDYAKYSQD